MASVTVGALPGTVDLQGKRGDKWGPIQFTPATPIDLTGRTWLAQIRSTLDEPATISAVITVDSSDVATGVIRITVPASETAKLATVEGKAVYYWDVQATLISDAEDVKTWFGGKVKVFGDVSVPA